MCGRYSNLMPPEAMRRLFGTVGPPPNVAPGFNCAPTQALPVVRRGREGRQLVLMRWGLVPPWSKGPGSGVTLINARAETVATKPAYRDAFRHRRCLVPCDGFYEWWQEGKLRRPYRITMRDGSPFALAGVWDRWPDPAGPWLESFAVIVTDANPLVAEIHDRMPVILPEANWQSWLDPDFRDPAAFLTPFPAEPMRLQALSMRINDPRNNDADCLLPAEAT